MPHPIPNSSTPKSDESSLELTEEIMRVVRIGFSRNGAMNTVMTSKIGSERRPKSLEGRTASLLKRGIRTTGAGRVASRHLSVTHRGFGRGTHCLVENRGRGALSH